jgi:tRNA pseudouridine55 synthase
LEEQIGAYDGMGQVARLSGILVVDKPRGPTSHDVVAQARRLLGTRSVGHAGTLDPMASGVLVLLVGEATKLAGYLSLDDKEYRATVVFGRATDTLDAEGTTTEARVLPDGFPEPGALEAALDAERRRVEQIPPAFSAISLDGQRSHRRARRGESVVHRPRPVVVRSLRLNTCKRAGADSEATAILEIAVSKGYYVRSLARDVGSALGVPAHLAGLERTASGPYRLEGAVQWPPDSVPELVTLEAAACTALPAARLTAVGEARALVGARLMAEHFDSPPPAALSAWLGSEGRLVALGRPAENAYRVVRGFRDNP